jgi:hypothetical protein
MILPIDGGLHAALKASDEALVASKTDGPLQQNLRSSRLSRGTPAISCQIFLDELERRPQPFRSDHALKHAADFVGQTDIAGAAHASQFSSVCLK